LTLRAYPETAINRVTAAIDMAAWFVENYAAEAELYGWRPIHIMRPAGGLAWRWWSLPAPALDIGPHAMIADWSTGIPFAYRAHTAGNVEILTGLEREAVLGHV
jgi:hypothetical protein